MFSCFQVLQNFVCPEHLSQEAVGVYATPPTQGGVHQEEENKESSKGAQHRREAKASLRMTA